MIGGPGDAESGVSGATAGGQGRDCGPRLCPVLREIQSGNFASLLSSECVPECRTYHRIFYLEDCLGRSVVPEHLDVFLNDDSCHVRRLCQKIAAHHGLRTRHMLCDPYHAIRAAHLDATESLDELLQSVDDENRLVRCCILRRIQAPRSEEETEGRRRILPGDSHLAAGHAKKAIAIPDDMKEEVLLKLNEYINDKDPTVRLEFARALRVFTDLSSKFILKLFDKKNLGLFIYGAEDEMHGVRKELIMSIETFTDENTVGCVLDYLIDMLNDEAETVRETVVTVLHRLSKRYDLTVDDNQLRFILSGLEESNTLIRQEILGILAHLRYQSVDIFFYLTSQSNIEDAVVFQHLETLVRRNRKLFLDNLSSIYRYSVFEEDVSPAAQASKTALLYSTEYLARLVVLRSLLKHRSVRVSGWVREGFKFLKLKRYGRKIKEDIAAAESLRRGIVSVISGQVAQLDGPQPDQSGMGMAERYLWRFLGAAQAWLGLGEKGPLIELSHSFMFQGADGSLSHTFGCDKILSASGRDKKQLRDSIISHLQMFSDPGLYRKMTVCEFTVNAPASITLHRDVPVRFECLLSFRYKTADIRLVAEDPATGRRMYSGLQEKVTVVIDGCPPVVVFYIAVLYGDTPFRLSNACETAVVQSGSDV